MGPRSRPEERRGRHRDDRGPFESKLSSGAAAKKVLPLPPTAVPV